MATASVLPTPIVFFRLTCHFLDRSGCGGGEVHPPRKGERPIHLTAPFCLYNEEREKIPCFLPMFPKHSITNTVPLPE